MSDERALELSHPSTSFMNIIARAHSGVDDTHTHKGIRVHLDVFQVQRVYLDERVHFQVPHSSPCVLHRYVLAQGLVNNTS